MRDEQAVKDGTHLCTVGLERGVIWAACVHSQPGDSKQKVHQIALDIARIHRAAATIPDAEVRTMTVAEVRAARWGSPVVPDKPKRERGVPPTAQKALL